MEPFPIVTIPAKSLREPSRDLSMKEVLTPEFQSYLDRLIFTMQSSNGVGIASVQVGKNIRAIVVDMPEGPTCFINPEILKTSEATEESEEGCLSVPDTYGIVIRHKKITVSAFTRHGRRVEFEVKRFPAVVFQHEIDHTNGVLFIDKAVRLQKTGKHI